MKNRSDRRLIIGSLIIVASFMALVAGGMRSTTFRSLPVSRLRAADHSAGSFVGQRLRAVGFVGPQQVSKVPVRTADGIVNINHFTVVEREARLTVEYRDSLPDTFRVGGPVQVDGVYTAPGQMRADHVLTKCPSKYDSADTYKAGAAKTVAGKVMDKTAKAAQSRASG